MVYTKEELYSSNTQRSYPGRATQAAFLLGGIGTGNEAAEVSSAIGKFLINRVKDFHCRIHFLQSGRNQTELNPLPKFWSQN